LSGAGATELAHAAKLRTRASPRNCRYKPGYLEQQLSRRLASLTATPADGPSPSTGPTSTDSAQPCAGGGFPTQDAEPSAPPARGADAVDESGKPQLAAADPGRPRRAGRAAAGRHREGGLDLGMVIVRQACTSLVSKLHTAGHRPARRALVGVSANARSTPERITASASSERRSDPIGDPLSAKGEILTACPAQRPAGPTAGPMIRSAVL
jgi:hypothetical protein